MPSGQSRIEKEYCTKPVPWLCLLMFAVMLSKSG